MTDSVTVSHAGADNLGVDSRTIAGIARELAVNAHPASAAAKRTRLAEARAAATAPSAPERGDEVVAFSKD